MAVMLVPEAAMDEYDRPVLRQHDIRPPGQAWPREAVTEPKSMEALANLQFDFRVLSADARHQRGTLFRADDVGHQAALRVRLEVVAELTVLRCGTMIRATSAITGTTTEFPNCL